MKYKTIDDIGKKYRSLFGIYNITWKLPVFENVEEFKAYTFEENIDFEKATQKLFDSVSEEAKYQYGDDGMWNKCKAALRRQLADDLASKREKMMKDAKPSQYDVVGVSEERTIGRFDETADFFVGLFANEKVAKECVDELVNHKMAFPEKVQYLNNDGEVLEMEGETEKE